MLHPKKGVTSWVGRERGEDITLSGTSNSFSIGPVVYGVFCCVRTKSTRVSDGKEYVYIFY
jgi:hypothetical protein